MQPNEQTEDRVINITGGLVINRSGEMRSGYCSVVQNGNPLQMRVAAGLYTVDKPFQ
jgi:hypothetical protein